MSESVGLFAVTTMGGCETAAAEPGRSATDDASAWARSRIPMTTERAMTIAPAAPNSFGSPILLILISPFGVLKHEQATSNGYPGAAAFPPGFTRVAAGPDSRLPHLERACNSRRVHGASRDPERGGGFGGDRTQRCIH